MELSFNYVGIDIIWEGKGINEVGKNKKTGKVLVKIDKKYFRPAEVNELQGDYSKARKELGWEPKTSLEDLVKLMIRSGLKKTKGNLI